MSPILLTTFKFHSGYIYTGAPFTLGLPVLSFKFHSGYIYTNSTHAVSVEEIPLNSILVIFTQKTI